jgi:hypothetical protein
VSGLGEKANPIFDAFENAFEDGLQPDDAGGFELRPKATSPEDTSAGADQPAPPDTSAAAAPAPDESIADQADAAFRFADHASAEAGYSAYRSMTDKKMNEAYGVIDALKIRVARLEGPQVPDTADGGPSTEATPPMPSAAEILDNPEAMDKYITARVEATVAERTAGLEPLLEEKEIHDEWNNFASRHPEANNPEAVQAIRSVLGEYGDTNMGIDLAFRIALDTGKIAYADSQPEPAPTPAPAPASPGVPADLRERASRLAQPVSSSTDAQMDTGPEIGSIEDAISAGFAEVLGD